MNRRLLQRIKGLGRDEHGVAMTEFVMFLPVFVLIFIGIFELGRVYDGSLRARGMAFVHTVEKFRSVQDTSFKDAITSNGPARWAATPVGASIDSTSQLFRTPPNQRAGIREVVARREAQAFSQTEGLGQHGSLGEALGRVRLVQAAGVELLGVDHIINDDLTTFFGDSPLALELFDDRPQNAVSSSMETSGIMGQLGARANQMINSAGARSAIGANVRYGTLTGRFDSTVPINSLGDVEVSAWYSVLAPTYTHEDDRKNGQMSAIASRITFEGQNFKPYQAIMRYNTTPELPILPSEYEVPNPVEEEPDDFFSEPLNYGDDFYP
ncbi:pilus assembly protein [Lujinxingia vulgaris]|uniref:Pilus assembly protein n=1 Tax=Lujinxingia vulgaris TaxID=2600176 RepID=A0A5C6XDA1_9DELT|nr:TadE family protein [Lujinxingia vulgaris]TXD35069.1 pilus assembly protein [Lujinxingia vulgaris]